MHSPTPLFWTLREQTVRASTTMSMSMSISAAPKLPLHNLPTKPFFNLKFSAQLLPANPLRFASQRRLSSPSLRSDLVEHEHASQSSISSLYTSSVASPPSFFHLSPSSFSHRHIILLNLIACLAAVSATWLFFSAIPALLAFKKAAESLEKLMDVTREELPDTMAAIRLSGMEISDLTVELSDLGQEITQGVRSSTRAVRVAEERLRHFTNMSPSASLQNVTNQKSKAGEPIVATTAREMREGIGKARALIKMFLSFTRVSRMAFNCFTSRAK